MECDEFFFIKEVVIGDVQENFNDVEENNVVGNVGYWDSTVEVELFPHFSPHHEEYEDTSEQVIDNSVSEEVLVDAASDPFQSKVDGIMDAKVGRPKRGRPRKLPQTFQERKAARNSNKDYFTESGKENYL